jgi:hypothetical protein
MGLDSTHIFEAADNSTSTEARPSKDRQSNFISGKDVDDLGVLKIEQCTPNLGQFLWGKSLSTLNMWVLCFETNPSCFFMFLQPLNHTIVEKMMVSSSICLFGV